MIKVSYVITVFNKQKYISKVLDSLKKIKGDFRKEYIIVDDGSTDDSLTIIKEFSLQLPNVTIITHPNQGPARSTNIGIFIAQGEFIQFVDGDDIIDEDSTLNLLETQRKTNLGVVFGLTGKYDHENNIKTPGKHSDNERVISNPLKYLFNAKVRSIRKIGSSSSLVSKSLIEEAGGSDDEIFIQDYSLALRCASLTNFAFCSKTICYEPLKYDRDRLSYNKKFEVYNAIQAIRNFIDYSPEKSEIYKKEIYKSVISSLWKLNRSNLGFLPIYLSSKLFVKNIELDNLKKFIDDNLQKLSHSL
jgi:glycosyltransferase involved in cell wall biosynthesis